MKLFTEMITFLVPTYNDETTIEGLVEAIIKTSVQQKLKYKITLLNDASTDTTPKILQRLAKKYSVITVMNHEQNQGYGATIRDLYYSAKTDWMVTLPGDYQFEPVEVMKLLQSTGTADLIIGKRQRREDSWQRRLQSKSYNFLVRSLFQLPVTDVNSIRLMKTNVLQQIKLDYTSAFVDAELVIRAHRHGLKVLEILIAHKERESGGATGGKFFKTILPTIIDLIQFLVRG